VDQTLTQFTTCETDTILNINLAGCLQYNTMLLYFIMWVTQLNIWNFYRCTVHSDICRVHSPTNALLLIFKEHIKIYIKIHINIAATCFGLRLSSGSLHWTWLKLYLR